MCILEFSTSLSVSLLPDGPRMVLCIRRSYVVFSHCKRLQISQLRFSRIPNHERNICGKQAPSWLSRWLFPLWHCRLACSLPSCWWKYCASVTILHIGHNNTGYHGLNGVSDLSGLPCHSSRQPVEWPNAKLPMYCPNSANPTELVVHLVLRGGSIRRFLRRTA